MKKAATLCESLQKIGIVATPYRMEGIAGVFLIVEEAEKLLTDDQSPKVGDVWVHEEGLGPHYAPKVVVEVLGEENLVMGGDGGVWTPRELEALGWRRR